MSELLKRLEALSPEKRRLLELRLQMAKSEASGPELRPRERTGDPFPVSFAQQRLWLLDRMAPGTATYNIAFHVRLKGRLDVPALERALDAMRERHETLRTTFVEKDGEPVQVIHPFAPSALPVVDLSRLPKPERDARAEALAYEDANTGFDLLTGPVLRATLLKLAADEHLLFLTMHHITSDGWSMSLMVKELASIYAAFTEGKEQPLPELPLQYADFAVWQREYLAGDVLERHLKFWRERLAGAPPVLDLPLDRPRPAVESHRGMRFDHKVPPELAAKVKELARAEGATLFVVLLAALRVVLGRHAGQDDVVVGTAVANRTRGQVEKLIGFFVNTLALRGDLSDDPTFRALLRREKDAVLEAFGHQDLPFERIVEELKIPRDASRNPLFQTMFTVQNAGDDKLLMPGLEVAPAAVNYDSAKFDYSMDVYEEHGGFTVGVEFALDLFEEASARRLARHFHRFLEALVRDPDAPISALGMMDDEERETVLVRWNDTATEYPRNSTVHGLFQETAAAFAEKTAVRFQGEEIPYAELNARANRLARLLRERGVGAGTPVGMAVERSADAIVAVLGILKAGGAYVPLDASYPAERLQYMLENSEAPVLVVRGEVPAALAGFEGAVVSLSADRDAIAAQSPEDLDEIAGPESLAYVMYTSGSTGKPKGVATPHRAVARLVRDSNFAEFSPEHVTLHQAPLAFDASTLEIWGALLNGALLVVYPAQTPSLEELGAALKENGITTLWLPVGLFNQMVDERIDDLRGLKQLCAGGDALSVVHVRKALAALPEVRIFNGYGPTENTTFTTCRRIRPEDTERPSIPLGPPIANTRVYILDRHMRPCGVGVPGELVAAGDGLALGYVGREDLTAEKFVTVDLGGGIVERVYRTGDRARWLEDGTVEFLGRVDTQVKIRGFRIEPGEIETVLAAHPNVGEATVIAREDTPGDRRLVAYVTARNGVRPESADLREAVRAALPEYMVPAAFVVLDEMPLTPNGKVDRRALPAPEWSGSDEDYVAPEGETEVALAAIWAEVLKVERVGADDDFFMLGGHSLLATQVVSRVRQAFGVELPLRALFEAPHVRGLSARIDAALAPSDDAPGTSEVAAAAPPMVAVPREGELPLSFAQERMWFLEQFQPGTGNYNMPLVLNLGGSLDVEALRAAIEGVIARHEALRCNFGERDGQPTLSIHPPFRFDLPVVDVASEAEVDAFCAADANAPFDLAHGRMIRGALLRVSPEKHVLALNQHHVVGDGWSMGILFRELTALYDARVRGVDAQLPELPLQYPDFAVWQRKWLSGAELERQVRYWRDRLYGAPATIELPTDRPRPPAQSFRGAAHAFQIPPALSKRVKELTARENATLFMTTLAAFQAVLSRYARQDDVVVGSPIAGRNRAETENLIGFFVNTLALRADLSGDPTFRELLAQVRDNTLGAYAHQDLPFEKLVEELQVERSTAYQPVFQVMFAVQNMDMGGLDLPGVHIDWRNSEHRTAKFDLTLDLMEHEDAIEAFIEYATDLFDEATVERLGRHYVRFLEGALANPDKRVSEIGLVTDEEWGQLQAWNAATARPDYRRDVCMHQLFEAQAAKTPGETALIRDHVQLTYGELNGRVNQLARHLRKLGVGPEVRVGVLMERTEELIVALLAVQKAGGAYVPLDPNYPAERVAFMLEDTGVPVLLTQERLLPRLPELAARVVPVDAAWPEIAKESDANPENLARPENVGYFIYTSGSTGRPKGIQLEHRSAAIVLQWLRDELSDELRKRVLASTSICFDVSIAEIFGTLSWGGTIVLVKNALSLSTLEHDVYMASMVPSAAAELLRLGGIPSTLRSMNLGGEPVKPSLSNDLYKTGHVEQVINFYGPSEDTTYTSYLYIPKNTQRMTVGRPVANTQLWVLDRHLRPCPVGVPGELYIGGHGVTRGYHARFAMTAEKYLPDPFSAEPGARMYRTGDLCRYLPDGQVEYYGRLDTQVKIRGHRVEVGEVEATLATHPQLAESAVVVRDDRSGMARLVAYYVPELPAPPLSELRAYLKERLPEYMVPTAWVRMDALPHTPNGKVDRRSLPEPDQREQQGAFQPPRTPTEQVLAAIWSEVLGVEKVGRTDNFFELGGHSLVATQVMSRLREAFRLDLPLRVLFDASTVEALAEAVEAARREAEQMNEVPLQRVEREGDVPLSFAQERLWFIEKLQPGTSTYNMPMVVELKGEVDPDAFRLALTELVARHETLRTTFSVRDGQPVQVINPAADLPLPVVDLSHLPLELAEKEAKEVLRAEALAPFDLERGPVIRARLVHLQERRWLLAVSMHHICSDGWSMNVLFAELADLYHGHVAGEPARLPELPVQYADYAAWQRRWLSGGRLEKQLGYWRGKLAGAQPLELFTDRPRPGVQSFRGRSHGFELPLALVDELEAMGRREGTTMFMTLLAAFKVLLLRYTDQLDVVVGSPIAGRNRNELEGLIGFFVNTLPLRTDLSGDPTFIEVLKRVRETTLDAYAHQDVPFERLVDALKVERSLSRHPVFQVSFTVQSVPLTSPPIAGLDVVVREGEPETTKFDLTVGLVHTPEGVFCGIDYATDLFEEYTIRRMAEHFRVLLEGIVHGPTLKLSELPRLLDETERHRVVVEWNQTEHDVPARPVHRLVSETAARQPEKAAILFGGRETTYAELEARANRLAHHLVARGVGPESKVGLFVDRSPELFVGVLGILKAGGAYVPLDPAYPAERLRHMVDDSGLEVVVSTGGVHPELLAGKRIDVVDLAAEAEAIAARPATDPQVPVDLDNLAYVIYTSGSTGLPKGVLVPHRGIPNLVTSQMRRFGIDAESRVLQFASFSFDAAVSETFSTFVAGGTLVVAPREALLPGPALLSTLRGNRVTKVTLPPSALAMLSEEDLPELRTVVSAGEAVGPNVVARWGKGRRFVNAYGPTETTVGASCALCEPDGNRPPIGRAFENLKLYVLDHEGLPVPVGVPGELFVGGMGVVRGYHGKPGMTAEKFVPDPFTGVAGARMYGTGDRVRWRRDGQVEFLGRVDEQVKIRGFRIEPSEISALLSGLPGVRDALVIVRADGGHQRLVAYIVATPGRSPRAADLRAHLKARLPDYMVPTHFIVMDAFPMTPNGKVDRAELPAPEQAEGGDAPVAPQGELERTIAAVWQELLGLKSVGVNDNFFEIGGHSLLLAQLHEKLRETLGREVSMVDLFQYPTISALAAHLDAAARAERDGSEGEAKAPAEQAGVGRGSRRREMLRGRR
ncbi:MAG TPA: amino acid adenylation domain-containing protein [Longimicrobium sp.]|nr:amino acid adenylation domain-containing protein [Longimicrobium sp.]